MCTQSGHLKESAASFRPKKTWFGTCSWWNESEEVCWNQEGNCVLLMSFLVFVGYSKFTFPMTPLILMYFSQDHFLQHENWGKIKTHNTQIFFFCPFCSGNLGSQDACSVMLRRMEKKSRISCEWPCSVHESMRTDSPWRDGEFSFLFFFSVFPRRETEVAPQPPKFAIQIGKRSQFKRSIEHEPLFQCVLIGNYRWSW